MLKLSAFLELQIYVIRQRHDNSFKRKFRSFVYNFDRHANKVLREREFQSLNFSGGAYPRIPLEGCVLEQHAVLAT